MHTKILDKAEWQDYLDRFSKELGACLAEIEVAGLDIGDQIEAEWITITGISYDPRENLVAVVMVSKGDKDIEHVIHSPTELVVTESTAGVASLTFVDADKHKQIIKLKRPLLLPGPTAA